MSALLDFTLRQWTALIVGWGFAVPAVLLFAAWLNRKGEQLKDRIEGNSVGR